MSNFKSIGQGVRGLRPTEIGGFPLTLNVALTTVLRTNVLHCDYRQLILMRRLRNTRTGRCYRPVVIVGSLITLYIVIRNSFPSTFPANLRGLGAFVTAPWREQSGANAGDRRPPAFYRRINESTKTPTYGLFFLLDPNSTGYIVTSPKRGGDIFNDRAIEHDFGFSNCQQVNYYYSSGRPIGST